MKGDFSRMIFDRKKHYSKVLMQQGRVQLDSDWNEQQALNEYRTEIEAGDVIARCGAPKNNAGFEITTKGLGKLMIGRGRYYVDGILCENEKDVAYDNQPDLDNPPDVVKVLDEAKATDGIVYLDVWKRHMTAIDDPRIRESALNGPDTTTRVKTIWQVKVLPIKVLEEDLKRLKELLQDHEELQVKLKKLKASDEAPDEIEKVRDLLEKTVEEIARISGQATCGTPFEEWDDLTKPSTGKLNARTQKGGDDYKTNPCLLPPTAGYQRLENQLYRVEVHKKGHLGTATFKWSRDNGSVVTAIEKISGKEVTVRDVGPDNVLGFANGQWVEILDDRLELKHKAGELVQIVNVDPAKRILTMATAPAPLSSGTDGVNKAHHPKLRRWDRKDATATSADDLTSSNWIDIEGGIQVVFSTGTYHVGDYWLIPARTATGDIEWPPYEVPNTNPVPRLPLGMEHHYCRLALVHLDSNQKSFTVRDCRRIFYPLAEVTPAIHVTGMSWWNDDVMPLDRFMENGLRINVDIPYELISVSHATMIVTTEVPFFGQETTTPDLSFILDGKITLSSGSIQWIPAQNLVENFTQVLKNQPVVPVRVTLKGHTIWSDVGEQRLYLDGRTFGRPALRADNKTPRTAFVFPSGDGVRASDFESWLYVGPPKPETKPLVIEGVRFLTAAGEVSSAGVIKFPLTSTPNIGFKAGERVSTIEIKFDRPVRPEGLDTLDKPQSIRVDRLSEGGAARKIPGNIAVQNDVARFIVYKPTTFTEGSYRVIILGNASGDRPAVKAKDDGTRLDGDFNGQPGGDFVLPFKAL